ncbi:MAG: type II CAAX endopeptidase family protein [Planctomycetota bacterium]
MTAEESPRRVGFLRDETGRLRTVWRLLVFLSGFALIQIVTTLVVVFFMLLYSLVHGSESLEPANSLRGAMLWFHYLGTLILLPTIFGLAVGCRRSLDRMPVESMGLVRPARRLMSSPWVGLGLGVLPIAFGACTLLWMGGLVEKTGGGLGQALSILPLLTFMAFIEELVFRGYLFQNFLDIRRPVAGVFLTSILFWLLHSWNAHVWSSWIISVNLFEAGALFALAYGVSRNLWFPTALHLGWNFTQGGVFGIAVSGNEMPGLLTLVPGSSAPSWLSGGAFGLEGSVLMTGAEAALILFFLVALGRRAAMAKAESAAVLTSEDQKETI